VSVQVVFHYVVQLTNPATVLAEDVTAGTLHDVVADELPSITQQVEQNLSEFTCGDFAVKARNDDAWWDSAFGDSILSPFNRFPTCHYIDVFRGGVLVWQGDVDYKTISFDRKGKTISFTCLNPLNRLTQWSAELVRRPVPSFFDAGTSSAVGAGFLQDSTKTWYIDQVLNAVLVDSSGNLFPITGLYGMGTGAGRSGVSVSSGYAAPYYLTLVGSTPTAGPYRIIPLAVQTRVAPVGMPGSSGVTTGTDGTGRYINDPSQNFPINGFVGMCLFDDAGQVYPILSNTATRIYVGLTWTPPGSTGSVTLPAPTIATPFSNYAVRRSNYPNLLETLPDFRSVGLQAGDMLSFVTTGAPVVVDKANGFGLPWNTQSNTYTLAAVGPNANPPLTPNQAWTSESIIYDVNIPHDGVVVTTPYYRGSAVIDIVRKLFASVCGGMYNTIVGTLQINEAEFLDASGVPKTLPYADFGGKSVADALTELAVVMNCTLSCGFSGGTSNPTVTFYFQRRDIGIGALHDFSGNDASGLPKIGVWEAGPQWEQWYPQVTVTGANGVVAAAGSLRYGGTVLPIQSDYMITYDWVAQVRDRLWSFFGSRHKTSHVTVRAEYASGIGLFSRVSLTGSDEWIVYAIVDPVREPQDFIDLTLVSLQAWSFTPSDYLATTGPTDFSSSKTAPPPAPPIILSVTYVSDPVVTWIRKVKMSWPYPIGPLLGFQFTIWSGAIARPDKPFILVGFSAPLNLVIGQLKINPDGTFEHWIEGAMTTGYGAPPFVIDYMAALYDGELSKASARWILDESSHTGYEST
jgi:hypothetical protein